MKKYILLAVFAFVALAAAHAQTTINSDYQYEQQIIDSEAQYATQKITLMADGVALLDTLKCRPVLVIDSDNNFYATLGKYAVMFERLQGRMWNRQNEEVRMNLIKGKAPEISFRNVKTDVAVDPATIK